MSHYSFPDRQYDINRIAINKHITLPLAIPYRLDATDYVDFVYEKDFPAHEYVVVVEAPGTASPNPNDRFREIGPLQRKVELPQVQFSKGWNSYAKIGVVPKYNGSLTPYIGDLVRGATYQIHPSAAYVTTTGHRMLYRSGGVM